MLFFPVHDHMPLRSAHTLPHMDGYRSGAHDCPEPFGYSSLLFCLTHNSAQLFILSESLLSNHSMTPHPCSFCFPSFSRIFFPTWKMSQGVNMVLKIGLVGVDSGSPRADSSLSEWINNYIFLGRNYKMFSLNCSCLPYFIVLLFFSINSLIHPREALFVLPARLHFLAA